VIRNWCLVLVGLVLYDSIWLHLLRYAFEVLLLLFPYMGLPHSFGIFMLDMYFYGTRLGYDWLCLCLVNFY
jgi:hypothetical protein